MIVIVVISILGAIAFPSYMEQTRKGKRAEGKAKLADAAQKLERYYTDKGTYTTSLGPLYGLSGTATVYSGVNNDTGSAYTITAAAPSGSTIAAGYVLTATQNAGGHFSDPKCGNLTLTNTGVKGISGTGTVKDCW